MNHRERELFEAELRRLEPAPPPPEWMGRLAAARPPVVSRQPARAASAWGGNFWRTWRRWLVPATAAAGILALAVWRRSLPDPQTAEPAPNLAATPGLRADDVEIDRRLIATFDAVANMPGGEPVRFRCREWIEEVVFRDTARGVVIQQRTPRFEAVPVRFETY